MVMSSQTQSIIAHLNCEVLHNQLYVNLCQGVGDKWVELWAAPLNQIHVLYI
jgi:hypothetical protein